MATNVRLFFVISKSIFSNQQIFNNFGGVAQNRLSATRKLRVAPRSICKHLDVKSFKL